MSGGRRLTAHGVAVVVVILAAVNAVSCRGARTNTARANAASASAAARRALLLDPERDYWRQPAPSRFRVAVETTKGTFVLEIDRALAPRGVDRFYRLVEAGYFDDSRFFRVVPGFIAQFGIPGDPAIAQVWKDRAFGDDSVRASNVRGTIAFAMTGPNTRTTQLFISLVDNTRLDGQGFSPLGRVLDGMDVVDRLYGGYGESAGGGMRGGKQARMMTEGNAHLDRDYPMLDRLLRAYIVPAS
jgi:cyclophilin family peptidyl-prolyl cis-trans isomerase